VDGDNPDETFPASGGRLAGWLSIALAVMTVVLALVTGDGPSWAGLAFGVLLAGIGWVVFLRPRVSIEDDHLVLRNMLSSVRVPVAAVEEVAVQQVLAVRVGDKRYTSAAVGRSRRHIRRTDGLPVLDDDHPLSPEDLQARGFGLYVEERIRERAGQARDRLGIGLASPEQDALGATARRTWALPEIAWVGLSLLAFAVLVLT
jgi:hypothetical protein